MALSEEQKVIISLGEWNEETAQLVALAVQHASLADIERQVTGGRAKLFIVSSEAGAMLGAFVLRVDELARGSEGVIVAAAGSGRDIDLTASVLPVVEKMFINCVSVRLHTARTGLARKLMRHYGYVTREVVLVKDIT